MNKVTNIEDTSHEKNAVANKKWGEKFILNWGLFLILFFPCWFFESEFNSLGSWVAKFIPMINKLIIDPTLIGLLPANYFSLMSLFIPFFVLWIVVGDDIVERCRYGFRRLNRGRVETFIFIYVFSLPTLLLIAYLTYEAPFVFNTKSTGFGQAIFYFMLNSEWGLLLVGSFAGVIFCQVVVFILWLVLLPVAYFFANIKKG